MMRGWGSLKYGAPLFWKMVARDKRSITLDLHLAAGQELCDGSWSRPTCWWRTPAPGRSPVGVAYDALAEALNPRLVMLSISAFGKTGPYGPRAGFGTLAEAMSGYAL